MVIYIKNMVCNRCKMAVKSVFEKIGLRPVRVELGEIEIQEKDIHHVKNQLDKELSSLGFELLNDKKAKTIEKIKILIINLVQRKNNNIEITLSDYLSAELNQGYNSLSNLFSEVEGITIEKYYILQKIERIKELLVYDELTLSEIALQLNYSSVAYLSNQFKKITGLTPSDFKNRRTIKRKSIENL